MSIDLSTELMGEADIAFAAEVESAAASSGEVPPGKYHARLDGAGRKDPGGKAMWEMYFLILAGQYRGRKVKYALWMTLNETDRDGHARAPEQIADAKKRVQNEYNHAARVLGVKTKLAGEPARKNVLAQLQGRPNLTAEQIAKLGDQAAKDGVYVLVQGKHDFRDAIGAECVIETRLRASGTEGDDRKFPEVKQFGVFTVDDPKAKGVTLATAAEKAAPVANPAAAVGKPEDYEDLASGV